MTVELAGVYTIRHRASGRIYVGGSVMMKLRIRSHRQYLRRGIHHSRRLQADFDRDGEVAFAFAPLLICRPEDVRLYEQLVLDGFRGCDVALGYNTLPDVRGGVGSHHREESKRKISEGRKGWRHTPEAKAKMAAAAKGRRHTEAAKAKMSAAHKGRAFTERHRARISTAKLGHEVSVEARAKIGAASRARWAAVRVAERPS